MLDYITDHTQHTDMRALILPTRTRYLRSMAFPEVLKHDLQD